MRFSTPRYLKRGLSVVAVTLGLGMLLISQSSHNQTITGLVQPSQSLPNFSTPLSEEHQDWRPVLTRLQARIDRFADDYEARLLKGLLLFHIGDQARALAEIEQLTKLVPDFHLAHLVRGDMLASRMNAVAFVGGGPLFNSDNRRDQLNQVRGLQHEAWARLQAHLRAVDPNKVPLPLLHLGSHIQYALLVDKAQHRLYVFEQQGEGRAPRLVRDFYVSTGRAEGNKHKAGDLRTPEGVYFIISHIPDEKLPDKYGIGAYPMDYPNPLDQHLGKSGDGIWLHGTDRLYYSRPPLDSEGCVVLANLDLQAVRPFITVGVTPIIITNQIDWVDHSEWQLQRQAVLAAIESWRRDWESLDVERYLSHYASGFWNDQFNLVAWRQYKTRVNQGKTYQRVTFSDLSLFAYPRTQYTARPMVLASFRQAYQSNNFNSETRKQLYLTEHNNRWQITYEGR